MLCARLGIASARPPARKGRREKYRPLPTDPIPAGAIRNPGGCRPHRPRIDSHCAERPGLDAGLGPRIGHRPGHRYRGTDRQQGRRLRRQIRHQGRRSHRHPRPTHPPADQLDVLPIRDHARHHIAECIRLAKLPGLQDLRLAAWAHMLGFSGHFSTKSRTYSTTLSVLRADRAAYQRDYAIAAGLQPDLDSHSTLVVTDWHFVVRGYSPLSKSPPGGHRGLSHREGVDAVA